MSLLSISRRSLAVFITALFLPVFQLRFASDSNVLKVFALLAVAGMVMAAFFLILGRRGINRPPWLFLALLAMVLFSFVMQSAITDVGVLSTFANIFLIVALCAFYFLIYSRTEYAGADFFLGSLWLSLTLFCSINLLLWSMGLYREWAVQFVIDYESGKALMLGSLGIDHDRVGFLLSSGFNSYGAPMGLLVGLSLLGYRANRRFYYLLGAAIALASILLTDSRSALLYSVIAVVLSIFISKKRRWGMGWLAIIIIPFLPFIMATIMALIGQYSDVLIRSDKDTASLGGRGIVWLIVFEKFRDFDLMQVLGYGHMGQVGAGIGSQMAMTDEFANYANADALSMHNSYLQTLVNYGYLGLCCYLFSIFSSYWLIRKLSRSGQLDSNQTAAFLLVLLICMFFSNTEAATVFPNQLFMPLITLVLFLHLRNTRPSRQGPTAPKFST